ncbi:MULTISPECIES: Na+/H+ antiporter subunit G [Pseudoalteromonas]|uniref:Cation:proton antiporter n=2 Tax=Pseudoalteromonas TaxID=53246 RepID=A0A0F4QLA0_9GAMM|nr:MULTISPECIES: Na+/H+ antiporter subunit G [Pseudoalteromonas]KJZ08109.1 cation:proton antiporter [Pseudoalteromonas rubra]MCF2910189.1 Na+/H+ antiporter subunit G [Pseudoalteromonas sp. DL2-H2.2]QTL34193.1 Na+/H+ antiporter subunit G [Pseudoalteromonas viridis]
MMEWVISFLLLLGGSLVLVGSIGLVKMPDFFMRLHGPTKATTLGMACLLFAAMAYYGFYGEGVSVKEVLISMFLLITAPISGYMLIKSAIHHRLDSIESTRGKDKIEED